VIAPGTRHGSLRNWTGISISSPALTWCLLAEQVSVPDLVAAADFLVSGTHPLCSITELEAAVAARAGQRHVRALQRAVALVRVGPRSRRESHARLLFGAAGLPEPELNTKIFTEDGRFLAMSDLVWRVFRVAGEYEGEYHQERGQFRKDILRRERVEDNNWRLFRFTGDDLRLRARDNPEGEQQAWSARVGGTNACGARARRRDRAVKAAEVPIAGAEAKMVGFCRVSGIGRARKVRRVRSSGR